jgi:hypothetical protein
MGRKPLNGIPMTAAERKRRQRAKENAMPMDPRDWDRKMAQLNTGDVGGTLADVLIHDPKQAQPAPPKPPQPRPAPMTAPPPPDTVEITFPVPYAPMVAFLESRGFLPPINHPGHHGPRAITQALQAFMRVASQHEPPIKAEEPKTEEAP